DDGLRQNAYAGALVGALLSKRLTNRAERLLPGARLAETGHRLRAIGIVKGEDRRLMENARRAETGRVIGIAFDFSWSPLVAFDQQSDARAVQRHRRRKKKGPARYDFLRR